MKPGERSIYLILLVLLSMTCLFQFLVKGGSPATDKKSEVQETISGSFVEKMTKDFAQELNTQFSEFVSTYGDLNSKGTQKITQSILLYLDSSATNEMDIDFMERAIEETTGYLPPEKTWEKEISQLTKSERRLYLGFSFLQQLFYIQKSHLANFYSSEIEVMNIELKDEVKEGDEFIHVVFPYYKRNESYGNPEFMVPSGSTVKAQSPGLSAVYRWPTDGLLGPGETEKTIHYRTKVMMPGVDGKGIEKEVRGDFVVKK